MRRTQTNRLPLSVAAVAWERAASCVVSPVRPGLGACGEGGVVRVLGRVVAWRENATPGGSSSLVTWGPSAASAAPTAGIPAAASLLVLLLVLIGVIRALMLLCRLIVLLP